MNQLTNVLYVDNFRGFSDTYVPIKDVTFFVGENSTGKTTILSLLKLVTSPAFWLHRHPDFNSSGTRFGGFADMRTHNSKIKSFTVGMITQFFQRRSRRLDAFLLTFVERDGMPVPALFIYAFGDEELRIHFAPNQTRFKRQAISNKGSISSFITEAFAGWTRAYQEDDFSSYQALSPQLHKLYSDSPFIFVSSAVEEALRKSGNDKKQRRTVTMSRALAILEFRRGACVVGAIRWKPLRMYDEYSGGFSPEGDHTPSLMRKLLQEKGTNSEFHDFLMRIGTDTRLFDDVKTRDFTREKTSPFQVDVVINGRSMNLCNVGYGVSQALPVIVEVFARTKNSWFAIQQPEVHLHPRAQAALGDLFFEMATKANKRFVIETHSDYTIDRFRLNFKKD